MQYTWYKLSVVLERCIECDTEIIILGDYEQGQIIECPDCGTEYVVEHDVNGNKILVQLNLEGEDWGA